MTTLMIIPYIFFIWYMYIRSKNGTLRPGTLRQWYNKYDIPKLSVTPARFQHFLGQSFKFLD